MQIQPKLTKRETFGYSLGALGTGLSFNLVTSFYMFYSTNVLGISAGFIAWMLFAVRLWDAFSDPIIGTLTENIQTKWGKHKPWIVLGSITNALVVAAMFSPWISRIISPMALLVAVTALYVMRDITYTIIDVPYYAYAASFTNLRERDAISMWPRLIGGIAMIGVPALTRPMVDAMGGGSQVQGFFRWALVLMAIYVPLSMVTAKSIKKREISRREKPFTFREAWQTIKNNDQLLVIEAVFILGMTAITITQSIALFYFIHVWSDNDVFELFMLVAGAGMGIALGSYHFLAQKISRRSIFLISLVMPLVGYPVMFAISMLASTPFWMLPVVLATVGGFGFQGIIHSIFMVDTVAYGEWKLGHRGENIIFSLLTLIGKFAHAIAALITMGALHFAGYISTREGGFLSDLEAGVEQAVQQPESVGLALNLLMFAVPPFILVMALVLYLKKYKLHGNFLAKITQELEEKREAAAAADILGL